MRRRRDASKWLPRNQKTLTDPYLERYEARIFARVVFPEPSQPERTIRGVELLKRGISYNLSAILLRNILGSALTLMYSVTCVGGGLVS